MRKKIVERFSIALIEGNEKELTSFFFGAKNHIDEKDPTDGYTARPIS